MSGQERLIEVHRLLVEQTRAPIVSQDIRLYLAKVLIQGIVCSNPHGKIRRGIHMDGHRDEIERVRGDVVTNRYVPAF
jgi:hypothetical protein